MKIIDVGIRNVSSGDNVRVMVPSNIYESVLHDNVFVGPFVEIQRGCVIGRGSRIQSHSFICENVTLGENCFIGHNVTFANDLFRRGMPDPDPHSWITIRLGNNVTVGSSATILTHTICDDAVIGAGSIVVKPVNVKGIYAGNPARLIRKL